MLQKGNFRYVYVFYDGDNSGEYRAWLLPTYKSNRDKNYDLSVSDELSDYAKELNAKVRSMQNYLYSKNKDKINERRKEKELFYRQREVVIQCLEELCVRQCVCDKVEADDLIEVLNGKHIVLKIQGVPSDRGDAVGVQLRPYRSTEYRIQRTDEYCYVSINFQLYLHPSSGSNHLGISNCSSGL